MTTDQDRTGTTDPLLAVGAFSRACDLSVRSLRRYHAQGLLVPAQVDPWTGHRRYRASQLVEARTLARLRATGVPLADVARVLAARDPAMTREVLSAHLADVRAELDRLTGVVARLEAAVEAPAAQTPVHVRAEPDRDVLAVEVEVADGGYGSVLSEAFAQLLDVAASTGLAPVAPGGADLPLARADVERVLVWVPVAGPASPADVAGVGRRVLPARRVAVLVHPGPYDRLPETYEQLARWAATHAPAARGEVREVYVVPPGDGAPAELVTDVCWPLDDDTRDHDPPRDDGDDEEADG